MTIGVFPKAFFRVDLSTGHICGISKMNFGAALANLPEGQTLRTFDPAVNPSRQKWDFSTETWVERERAPGPESDPRYMRRTGYPAAGDQFGALVKIVEALIADPAVAALIPQPALDEFQSISDQVAAVKAAHPLPQQ